MAGIRWLETDTASNQNISSATACGAYTADADRAIMVQVFLDQVAGNGDYVMYVTLQVNGAGSAYVILPKTTMTAASGETAIGGQSGWINVRSGDVLTVYVDGLAGDTTTPDYITRWFELAALRPTTADRTLDVTATGEAGIDWANVGSPTTTVGLSGTTVKTATDVETDTADIQGRLPAALVSGRIDASAGAVANGAITAAAIATGAIDADALATDAVAEIVDAVWDEATSGHTTAGTTGKAISDAGAAGDPWAATTRTLTQSAASVTSTVSGTKLTIQRGDSLSASFTGVGATTGYTSIWFTVKYDKADTDAQAIIQIKKNTSGSGDGLLYVNGAAAADATKGSITINDASTGALTIALDESITDDLPIMEGLYYDIQYLVSGAVTTKTESICEIAGDVTRSIT